MGKLLRMTVNCMRRNGGTTAPARVSAAAEMHVVDEQNLPKFGVSFLYMGLFLGFKNKR